ncbi:retron system putative HNH endonuclease [Snodgrassella communis]|uniref:retron system putative HNH endonuclease n=1 Tax=Snodgrassella communis TaxID=2946699 RepID=UPI000C1E2CFE
MNGKEGELSLWLLVLYGWRVKVIASPLFKCRSKFPKEKFEWDNLFVSCTTDDHCGRYKDGPNHIKYQIDNLIKPDRDNPKDYFVFLKGGKIDKKSCLSKTDMTKADETIRVLNLNDSSLVNIRDIVYDDYYDIFMDLCESDQFLIEDESEGFKFSDIVNSMIEDIEEHQSVIDSVLSVITGEINSLEIKHDFMVPPTGIEPVSHA